ncbi:LysR family transcriptional regulator [Streptomyces sp. PLAI1-29]|uniref:LysR family transcriptional regulator n=1 Tax=Streptomyces zingiberis TaxID=2053010 RepID=A0ABX1BZT6_9ACTN|nr:LysR family transcriptional regulator [Streptomyces zingiberis]
MEYFVTVAEEDSFTRAAERLHVTQSALSHQIKALERETGGPLLERLPRGVRLTPMGRAFLPHAERAVRSAGQARRAARAAAGAEGGELHVATVHPLAVGVLPEVFARWGREHGSVTLVLHEYAGEDELREQLERGVADLAVGHRPAGWRGPVLPVGHEELALVVPPDDPLAERGTVRIAELAGRRWVRCGMEPVVDGVPFIDRACAEEGFTPRTAVRTRHTSAAVRMAAAGAGIAVAPTHAVTTGGCALVRLEPHWRRAVTVFSRVELAGAAALFAELVAECGVPGPETSPAGPAAAPPARSAPSPARSPRAAPSRAAATAAGAAEAAEAAASGEPPASAPLPEVTPPTDTPPPTGTSSPTGAPPSTAAPPHRPLPPSPPGARGSHPGNPVRPGSAEPPATRPAPPGAEGRPAPPRP